MLGSIKKQGKILRCNLYGDVSMYFLTFDAGADGAAPDGADPAEGVTLARTGEGVYTLTFDEDVKPRNVITGWVNVHASNPTDTTRYVSYTRSTGVVVFENYVEDGTTGISADGDLTENDECCIVLVVGNNKLTDAA